MAEARGSTPGNLSRAQRFAIPMSTRYRVGDERSWCQGRIENISRSGVLFRGERLLDPDTPVEICFVPAVAVLGEAAAEVICCGQIVRTVPPSGAETRPALAATILDYRFVRRHGLPRPA